MDDHVFTLPDSPALHERPSTVCDADPDKYGLLAQTVRRATADGMSVTDVAVAVRALIEDGDLHGLEVDDFDGVNITHALTEV